MRKKIFVIALVGFSIPLWHYVLTHGIAPGVPSAARARITESATVTAAIARIPPPVAQARVGIPARIRIPSIGVDATIEQVSLKPDGSMDVPKKPLDAAWYTSGPRPGETGSAVIDGHVDWWYGATGVFADLHVLKPGDTIVVQDDAGATVTFVVRASRAYDAAADAADVFGSTDGKSHLNLITCDGAWNKLIKQYTKRLVVFADAKTE